MVLDKDPFLLRLFHVALVLDRLPRLDDTHLFISLQYRLPQLAT